LAEGELTGIVSDNRSDVHSRIYRDSATGAYYLVAINDRSGNETVTFTLNLPEGDYALSYLDGNPLLFEDGRFTDLLTSYDVHVYQVTVPEPSSVTWLGLGAMLLARRYRRGS
jgi:hypothetical protein